MTNRLSLFCLGFVFFRLFFFSSFFCTCGLTPAFPKYNKNLTRRVLQASFTVNVSNLKKNIKKENEKIFGVWFCFNDFQLCYFFLVLCFFLVVYVSFFFLLFSSFSLSFIFFHIISLLFHVVFPF